MNNDIRLLKIQIILMDAGIKKEEAEKMANEIAEVVDIAAPTIEWPTYPVNPCPTYLFNTCPTYPTNPNYPWITYTDGISKETEINVTTFKA